MAQASAQIAFIINDNDFLLAPLSDDGLGEPFATVPKGSEDAYDRLRDALAAQGFDRGTAGLIFLPYEAFLYKKIRRKDLQDEAIETVFDAFLSTSKTDFLIDIGPARRAGGYTPVALAKDALTEAAMHARKAGLEPKALTSLFPSKLRTQQPVFPITVETSEARDLRKRPWLPFGLAAAIALAIGAFTFQSEIADYLQADQTAQVQPMDTRLLAMTTPPFRLHAIRIAAPKEVEKSISYTVPDLAPVFLDTFPDALSLADADVIAPPSRPTVTQTDGVQDDVPSVELTEESLTKASPEISALTDETLRPTPRPNLSNAELGAVLTALGQEPEESLFAPKTSSIPTARPPEIAERKAAVATTPQSSKPTNSTSSQSTQDAATTRGRTLSKNELSLVGVFGRPNSREAMFRTAAGRFVTKKLGQTVSSWKIVAIGADQVRLAKGNKTETLRLPN
ncbi:MAG: hypothetical protein AAF198_07025 [Pseudomonadota bacterium]